MTAPRYEVPDGPSREEERALLAALERHFRDERPNPAAWSLAGRLDATGIGWLQARRMADAAWQRSMRGPFARRGAPNLRGRGDSA